MTLRITSEWKIRLHPVEVSPTRGFGGANERSTNSLDLADRTRYPRNAARAERRNAAKWRERNGEMVRNGARQANEMTKRGQTFGRRLSSNDSKVWPLFTPAPFHVSPFGPVSPFQTLRFERSKVWPRFTPAS